MADATNDFLRFSAYSIKDLITRKLSEDSNFTDQVYEGSNLAILIDLVSYMYQCLIFCLNNAAAESMFSDTQIYENISRLCNFIGYHPAGYRPASLNLYIENGTSNDNAKSIYPCTAIDTGLVDSYGKQIYFSTIFDRDASYKPIKMNDGAYTNVKLRNGRWRHYANVFTASGIDYESFILDGIKSDSTDDKFVANGQIQVFVVPANDPTHAEVWNSDTNELFIQAYGQRSTDSSIVQFGKLYDNDDKYYSIHLNEDKTYEIKFGNGIIGRKLNAGDQVHVMYLDTNGPDGYIDLSQLSATNEFSFNHSPAFFGMSQDLYDMMFNDGLHTDDNKLPDIVLSAKANYGLDTLTVPVEEEGVADIRKNAPDWFKSGNRLITKKDYEFFVKANQNAMFDGVIDAKCMNNWDYMTTFYRWLFNLGTNPVEEVFASNVHDEARTKDPYRYLTKARLVQNGYEFVDSADANNIYLWIATTNDSDMLRLKQDLNSSIINIKTMTSETYPLSPIDVYFDLSFTPSQLFYDNLVKNRGSSAFDETKSYLEVTISDNSIYSNVMVTNKVAEIIQNAFYIMQCKLGQTIDYAKILDSIYQINGVERIRTVYYPDDYLTSPDYAEYKSRACDGISFASWSNTELIDIGDDLQLNNVTRTLEPFQFPKLAPNVDLKKKIKVIKKSMNTTNPVKF